MSQSMTDADCLRVYREWLCYPTDEDVAPEAAEVIRPAMCGDFDGFAEASIAWCWSDSEGVTIRKPADARPTYDGLRATAIRLGFPVVGMPAPAGVTVTVAGNPDLIASVDVMAESPSAVVLHVELKGRDIEPNCAGRGDVPGGGTPTDGITFFRKTTGGGLEMAELTVTGLPFGDVDGIPPAWFYTEGGYGLVTVTIMPNRRGRTVYERKEVDGE